MNGMNVQPNSRIPPWLKIGWTAWVLVWAPLYWKHYGAQNFLYFCDLGNLLIALGLWMESRLILSWQAVGLLVFQTLYAVDLITALVLRIHPIGGTEYMFDPTIPLPVRLLGLYHLAVPLLLLWAVQRLDLHHRRRRPHQLFLASRVQRKLRPRDRPRTAPHAGVALPAGVFGSRAANGVLADALGARAMGDEVESSQTVMYSGTREGDNSN